MVGRPPHQLASDAPDASWRPASHSPSDAVSLGRRPRPQGRGSVPRAHLHCQRPVPRPGSDLAPDRQAVHQRLLRARLGSPVSSRAAPRPRAATRSLGRRCVTGDVGGPAVTAWRRDVWAQGVGTGRGDRAARAAPHTTATPEAPNPPLRRRQWA